jgi:hypothetical protein
VVLAADHVRDLRVGVVERRGEVIRRPSVRTQEHEVLELLVRVLDAALDRVVPDGRALVGHAEADCAVVLVGVALGEQPAAGLLVAREAVELELERAVPVEPEPAERALDLLDGLLDLAARVRILDAQAELAARVTREEPVEERRADAADVEQPRRAGRKTDADVHDVRPRKKGAHRGTPVLRTRTLTRLS